MISWAIQGNGGNGGAGDGEGDLPAWCDPTDPMGAWMNYVKVELVSQYREDARHLNIFLRELFLDLQVCESKIFLDPPVV